MEKMKILAIVIICIFTAAVYGQEAEPGFDGHTWKAPYTLLVPAGWTVERFPIPIGFAPGIPYTGVEDIRFAPGWSKMESDEYWSYAFLWYLDGVVKADTLTIERNLKVYYSGLVHVNGGKIPRDKIIPVETSFKVAEADKGDLKTFSGTIKMTDYMKQQTIVLNCKVHLKSCPGEDKTFLFHELSPQPSSHKIWTSLDQLWLGFKCTKN